MNLGREHGEGEGQEIDTNTFLICNLWRAINLSSCSCMRCFFMDFSLSSLHIWQQRERERKGAKESAQGDKGEK